MSRIKRRTFEILDAAAPGDTASRMADIFILSLIGVNAAALIVETVPGVRAAYFPVFRTIEIASIVIFTVEYLLRIWSAEADPRFSGAVRGRLRFMMTPLAIVDLLAVLPFWLPFLGIDLRSLRILRFARVLRVAKLARYSRALRIMGRVLMAKRAELTVTFSVGAMLLIVAGTLMYYAERAAQPEVFASIPHALWWGVATLTTVGYGDVYPVTVWGRALGSVVAVLGIGMFALPAGILGSGFLEELEANKTHPVRCPRCGEVFDPRTGSHPDVGL